MSGIVSLVNGDKEAIDCQLLEQMTQYMTFSAPDGNAIWHKDNVGLGCSLLQVNSEPEKQPFSLDDRLWIVADARLDGRKELVAALQESDRSVSSECADVELIWHAYRLWDAACVERLQGDFVFIIWDDRQQKLFCARDQFGIAPFYYATVGKTLICSNTLNTIRTHPQISNELNELAVSDFFVWGMNMTYETTIFADIHRLPPAHTLTWSAGKLEIQRYWQLPRTRPLIFYKNPQEYIEHFSHLFQQAVSDRLRSHSTVTHLSGGMDSTSVAAVANQVLLERGEPFDFQAFTTRDRLMMPEEDSYARMVAHYIGIPINEVNLEGYFNRVPSAKPDFLFPEPTDILERSAVNDFTKQCSDRAKVILTGLGGDPGLRFGEFYWVEWWKHGLQKEIFQVYRNYILTHRSPKLYLRRGRAYWQKVSRKGEFYRWFNPDFANKFNLKERYERLATESVDGIARYGMANSPFWSNLFEKYDPGASGIPVKHYHPYFDSRLVDFLISIPPIPWLVDKKILREAMKKKLPEATLTRRKTTCQAPPEYTKAIREMPELWLNDLFKNTPILAEYLDTAGLGKFLESGEINTPNFIGLNTTFTVAYWLRSYQVAAPNGVKLESVYRHRC